MKNGLSWHGSEALKAEAIGRVKRYLNTTFVGEANIITALVGTDGGDERAAVALGWPTDLVGMVRNTFRHTEGAVRLEFIEVLPRTIPVGADLSGVAITVVLQRARRAQAALRALAPYTTGSERWRVERTQRCLDRYIHEVEQSEKRQRGFLAGLRAVWFFLTGGEQDLETANKEILKQWDWNEERRTLFCVLNAYSHTQDVRRSLFFGNAE